MLIEAALKSGGIDVQFAPTSAPGFSPAPGIDVTGPDKALVGALKTELSVDGKLQLRDPNKKPPVVVGGMFVGVWSPRAAQADIYVGVKPIPLAQ